MSAGRSMSMRAPGDVRPGAIMLAPLRMNLIAPLSTCSLGNKFGSAIIKILVGTMLVNCLSCFKPLCNLIDRAAPIPYLLQVPSNAVKCIHKY